MQLDLWCRIKTRELEFEVDVKVKAKMKVGVRMEGIGSVLIGYGRKSRGSL